MYTESYDSLESSPSMRQPHSVTGFYSGATEVKVFNNSDTDEAILSAIAVGDQAALSELYTRYSGLLMSIAYKILADRTDSEDLIHDVFLEVWKKAGNYDTSRGKVKTWVALITRSRALDRLRSLKIAKQHAMAATSPEDSIHQRSTPDSTTDQALIRAAVESLEEPQRKVLYLNYFKGLSCQEISNQLDTPLGTVKARLRAAVKNLRSSFHAAEQRA